MRFTERSFLILTGLIVSIFFSGATVIAVLYSSGTFDDVYEVTARFDAAGQGLIKDSDVKVRGVNIGTVKSVRLDDSGQALVTLRIRGDEDIPRDARAVVRPKTLFGEKFVDVEVTPESEGTGPFLSDGDEIADTVGSFELEEVLVGAQQLLEAVDPADLGVILDTLASASEGQGERIRNQIAAWAEVSNVFAEHDADTRRFLDDFERLVGAFERGSDDLVALSRELNTALPSLNAQGDTLDDFLDDAADVSRHLAEVFEKNQSTLEKMVTQGGKTVQVLHDHRTQVPKLVVSLRDFSKILAQASVYEGNFYELNAGGSGRLATVKLVTDANTLLALACAKTETHPLCGALMPAEASGTASAPASGASVASRSRITRSPVTEGVDAIVDLVGQTLAGLPAAAFVETVR